MNPDPDAQLFVLAWIVSGGLVACLAAVVAIWRSGRTVPPGGGAPRRPRRGGG